MFSDDFIQWNFQDQFLYFTDHKCYKYVLKAASGRKLFFAIK